MDDDYWVPARWVGGITFLGAWVYAVVSYGFFLGVGLGWIPALVIGAVAGLLWPLLLLAIGAIILLVWFNG